MRESRTPTLSGRCGDGRLPDTTSSSDTVFEFGEPALKVAPSFPNSVFAVPYFFKTGGNPNMVTYGPSPHEAFYLAGALAALMSKSKKIGSIGGFPIPQQNAEHNAYKLGARAVCPQYQGGDRVYQFLVGCLQGQGRPP